MQNKRETQHLENQNPMVLFSHSPGEIGFLETSGRLLHFFDREFLKIAKSVGAVEEYYPVLLKVDSLEKTGYLRRSPYHCIFCSSLKRDESMVRSILYKRGSDKAEYVRNLQEPEYTLSPSACFHVFEHYQNKTLADTRVVTLMQNVFRDEEETGWSEMERLRDYKIREIVFFGDPQYVRKKRETIMDLTKQFLEELGLPYQWEIATDAFMFAEMKRFEKYQRERKSKYELRLKCDEARTMAAASFNLHETAFTRPFQIKIDHLEETVSGCVGYGLERWILAFMYQFGGTPENWPEYVRRRLEDYEL